MNKDFHKMNFAYLISFVIALVPTLVIILSLAFLFQIPSIANLPKVVASIIFLVCICLAAVTGILCYKKLLKYLKDQFLS